MKKEEILEHIIVIEIYILLTILAFHRLFILGFNEWIIGDFGDAWQSIWNIWWVKNSFLKANLDKIFYVDYQFYPYGSNLIFHSLSLVTSTIGGLIAILLNNLRATYNILISISFILSGYFMFLLAKYLTKDSLISFLTGFAYTFSPYHVSKAIGYLNLSSIQWIPLFFLFFESI